MFENESFLLVDICMIYNNEQQNIQNRLSLFKTDSFCSVLIYKN